MPRCGDWILGELLGELAHEHEGRGDLAVAAAGEERGEIAVVDPDARGEPRKPVGRLDLRDPRLELGHARVRAFGDRTVRASSEPLGEPRDEPVDPFGAHGWPRRLLDERPWPARSGP